MNKLLKLAVFCILLAFVCIGTAEAKRHFQPAVPCHTQMTFNLKNRLNPVTGICVYTVKWEDDETGESGVRYVFEDSNYGAGYVDSITDRNGNWEGNYWTPTPYPRSTILSNYGEPIMQISQSPNQGEIRIQLLENSDTRFGVKLFDLNGQCVDAKCTYLSDQILINTQDVNNGVFFLVIIGENESFNYKILINR